MIWCNRRKIHKCATLDFNNITCGYVAPISVTSPKKKPVCYLESKDRNVVHGYIKWPLNCITLPNGLLEWSIYSNDRGNIKWKRFKAKRRSSCSWNVWNKDNILTILCFHLFRMHWKHLDTCDSMGLLRHCQTFLTETCSHQLAKKTSQKARGLCRDNYLNITFST